MRNHELIHKLTEQSEKIKRLQREIRRMQVNCDRVARVRAIKLPEPRNEDEAQLIADMAQEIMRAIE